MSQAAIAELPAELSPEENRDFSRNARGIFRTIPPRFLGGVGAAGRLALINLVGTFGGFGDPFMMGYAKDVTGSTNTGLLVLSAFLVVSTALTLCLKFLIKTE